jgi:hypothetical protein
LADASVAIDLEGRYPVPNLVSIVESLMEATWPPMRIGRKTILSILKAAPEPKFVLDIFPFRNSSRGPTYYA